MFIDQVTAFFTNNKGELYGIGYTGGGVLYTEELTTDEFLFKYKESEYLRTPVKIDIVPDSFIKR